VSVRFQADANLRNRIVAATIRREPTLEFATASQAGLAGLPDPEVLAIAAKAGRVLVTHDLKTMPKHFADFLQTGTSPDVVLVPQRMPSQVAVEELILIWAASDADEWVNRISRIPL